MNINAHAITETRATPRLYHAIPAGSKATFLVYAPRDLNLDSNAEVSSSQ